MKKSKACAKWMVWLLLATWCCLGVSAFGDRGLVAVTVDGIEYVCDLDAGKASVARGGDVSIANIQSFVSFAEISCRVTEIAEMAFCAFTWDEEVGEQQVDNTQLKSVTIPPTITNICAGAFSGCVNLTSVTIPNSVRCIEGAAFIWCTSLTNVTIGSRVNSIECRAFEGCSSLMNVYFNGPPPRTYDCGGWRPFLGISEGVRGHYEAEYAEAWKEVIDPATGMWEGLLFSDKYTVSFDSNGGEGEMYQETVVMGAKLALPACPFTHPTYSFEGWAKTRERAADRIVDYAVGDEMEVTGDMTLYAVWGGNFYKVRLHGNGVATASGENWVDLIVPFGESQELPANPFTETVSGDASGKLRGWSRGTSEYDWRTSDDLLPKNWTVFAKEEYFPEWKQLGWADDVGWWEVLHLYAIWDNEVTVKIRREDGEDVTPASLKEHIKFQIEGDRWWNTEAELAVVPPGTHKLKIKVDSGYETYVPGWRVFYGGSEMFPDDEGAYTFNLDSTSGPTAMKFDIFLTEQAETIPVYFNCSGEMTDEQQAEWPDFPAFDPERVVITVYAETVQSLTTQWAGELDVPANDRFVRLPAGTYWVHADYRKEEGMEFPYWSKDEFSDTTTDRKITVADPDGEDVDFVYRPFGKSGAHDFALLTFDSNGGNASVDEMWYVRSQTQGNLGYLSAAGIPGVEHPEGLTFTGWYTADGTEKVESHYQLESIAEQYLFRWSKTRQTFRAHWQANQQTVHFDANGGTSKKASVTCPVGGKYSGFPTATWENHVFQGWYDDPEGGNRVRIGMEVTAAAERTLYAHWKRQIVHFDATGGKSKKESVTCYVGGTYSGFPACTWENHVFQGWYDDPEGGSRVKNGMTVTSDAERTLYARWKRQTVLFDANGGTCKKKSVMCYVGGTYTTLASASWDGRKFLGWYDARTGGNRVKLGMDVTADAERTLYAHWEQTVRFDGNGGASKKASVACVIGETYTTLASASRNGYTFAGWYDAPEGGTRVRIGMTVTTDRERTLYARWKAKASGTGLAISGFTAGETPRMEGARRASVPSFVLTFEAEADRVYELLWTPSLGGNWTTLRRWTAETDGETSVPAVLPADSPAGFFRVVGADADE